MTAPPRLGRYEIVRHIGKSMTDVYLAVDTVENRKAVLKLVKPDGGAAAELVMEAERRGAAIQKELHLLDPRVIEVYDFGDLEGYFFVAMQYVEGRNLAEVLGAEQTVEPMRAAIIALELCEQLAKFHGGQAAVVHGDIKPSNIHLGPNDTVRLLDFGIAKTLRANSEATIHSFGSPSYCSPERLSRSEVDQQSDLWAVGATLYEMLAGVPPYQADNTRKLASLIRSRRPPRALPPACPSRLRAIVSKSLAPNPRRRYESADQMQTDLQAFLEHQPTLAEKERRWGWSANATATMQQAARTCWQKVTRMSTPRVQLLGAAVWFAAGMSLYLGGSQPWRTHSGPSGPPPASAVSAVKVAALAGEFSPPAVKETAPAGDTPALYVDSADRIFETYRSSADPSLNHFDWLKAEVCLEHAVTLGDHGDQTLGELALAKGYATLERVSDGKYSAATAAWLRHYARDQFAVAVQKMPASPDPHLALARLYVYSLPDPDAALQEFATAQKLGAIPGPREIEQMAAANRIRAAASESGRQRPKSVRSPDPRRPQWQ